MKRIILALLLLATYPVTAQSTQGRFYELRIYYAHSGQLDALIGRFRNHTTGLFEKHGMKNEGYWIPVDNTRQALYYVLSYPDRNAREQSWKAFQSDPEWITVKSRYPKEFVDSVKSTYLHPTDLRMSTTSIDAASKVFELRIYTCFPGRLPNLMDRFRAHTLGIFESHGMKNIAYYTTDAVEGEQPKLVYWLAHQSEASAKQSWDAFGKDPAWIKARDESEKEGRIVEKVESVYLRALDFSPLR